MYKKAMFYFIFLLQMKPFFLSFSLLKRVLCSLDVVVVIFPLLPSSPIIKAIKMITYNGEHAAKIRCTLSAIK
jgi:hypothetical protein